MGYIFHSKVNNEGEQQVLYKFSYQAKPIIISTGIHVKKANFSKLKGETKSKLAKIESIILDSRLEAENQVPPKNPTELKQIILLRVEGRTTKGGVARITIKEAWQNRIDYFERAKKSSSCRHNIDSMRVVMGLLSNMYVDEITMDHIKQLRQELLIGRSSASVAGYLRDLRAAIISVVGKGNSPFIGVSLPKADKKKNVALTWEEFQKMRMGPFRTREQELSMDMFVFRYYCLGMRIKDQLLLRRDQIVEVWDHKLERNVHRLIYTTHKTKKPFDFKLPEECLGILEKYPNGKYVFPIMNTPKATVHNVISAMNKSIKKVAKYAGIKKTISTHSARHTFAFINQNKGLLFLQKAFDHEIPQTTQGYVESLNNQDNLMEELWG